jgi:anhydro-N-acetylmuramic acid kinase
MVYKVLSLYSGSVYRGLEIAYILFEENGGRWTADVKQTQTCSYTAMTTGQLSQAADLNAAAYLALHDAQGAWLGRQASEFIEQQELDHRVDLVVSRGFNPFQPPVIAELGHGAAIASATGLAVVSDLTVLDGFLGGREAPAAAVAEQLLPNLKDAGEWKDAVVTGLLGVLRWREAYNMLAEATGANRNSIGGALWLGGEA